MRCLILLGLSLCLPNFLSATIYTGRVVDGAGQPVSYVNVVQKMNPTTGVSTDSLGNFSIEITKTGTGDLLYFSFIGYTTVKTPITALSPDRPIKVVLEEDPLELFEVVVTNIPNNKMSRRKFMGEVLVKMDKQLERDYAQNVTHFIVASNLGVTNHGIDMTHEHVVAEIQDWPFLDGQDGHDSLAVSLQSVKHYTNPKYYAMDVDINTDHHQVSAEVKVLDFKDSVLTPEQIAEAKLNWENELSALDLKIQKAIWRIDAQKLFESCEMDLKLWTLEGTENGLYVMHYRTSEKKYLGLVKISMDMVFFVDPIDYHVMRITNQSKVRAFVPLWGYKIPKDYLQIINTFDLTGEKDIQKFRLKRIRINAYGELTNQMIDGVLALEEKQAQVDFHVISTKGDDVQFTADVKSTVMEKINVEER